MHVQFSDSYLFHSVLDCAQQQCLHDQVCNPLSKQEHHPLFNMNILHHMSYLFQEDDGKINIFCTVRHSTRKRSSHIKYKLHFREILVDQHTHPCQHTSSFCSLSPNIEARHRAKETTRTLHYTQPYYTNRVKQLIQKKNDNKKE